MDLELDKTKGASMKTITRKKLAMPEPEYWDRKHEIIEAWKLKGYFHPGSLFMDGYVTMEFVRVEE